MAAMAQESASDLERRLALAQRELSEAREQQAATAEVLQVISSSPGKLEHVFETILANATRLCEAKFGNLFLLENDAFRAVAMHGPSRLIEWLKQQPLFELRDHPRVPIARVAITKEVLQVPDFRADQSYIERDARIDRLPAMAADLVRRQVIVIYAGPTAAAPAANAATTTIPIVFSTAGDPVRVISRRSARKPIVRASSPASRTAGHWARRSASSSRTRTRSRTP